MGFKQHQVGAWPGLLNGAPTPAGPLPEDTVPRGLESCQRVCTQSRTRWVWIPQPVMEVPGCTFTCPLLRVPTQGRAVPAGLAGTPAPLPCWLPMVRIAMHDTTMLIGCTKS